MATVIKFFYVKKEKIMPGFFYNSKIFVDCVAVFDTKYQQQQQRKQHDTTFPLPLHWRNSTTAWTRLIAVWHCFCLPVYIYYIHMYVYVLYTFVCIRTIYVCMCLCVSVCICLDVFFLAGVSGNSSTCWNIWLNTTSRATVFK